MSISLLWQGKKHHSAPQPPHVTPTPFKPEEDIAANPPGDTPSSSSYSNGEEKAGGGNYDTVTSANLEVLTQILAEVRNVYVLEPIYTTQAELVRLTDRDICKGGVSVNGP